MAAILSTSFAAPVTDWAAQWSLASVSSVQVGHLCMAESEVAQVTKVGPGTMVSVRRGVESTSAATHASGTPVVVYRAGDVPVGAASSVGTAPLHQGTVRLSDAQIKALPTTAVTVVGAPGLNRVVVAPVTVRQGQVVLYLDWYGDYTNIDTTAAWKFALGSGVNGSYATYGSNSTLSNGFLVWGAGGTSNPTWLLNVDDVSGGGNPFNSLVDFQQQRIVFSMLNGALGNLTGGHPSNTLTVSVLYHVLDVTTGLFV